MDLLEEAKKRYPIGTKFRTVLSGRLGIVKPEADYGVDEDGDIFIDSCYVYHFEEARWAEILFKPTIPLSSDQSNTIDQLINSIWTY